jgi:hypothetical protein
MPYDVSSLADTLTGSDWYLTVTAGYEIGAATHLADYLIPDAGPTTVTDQEIQALIQDLIQSGAIPSPSDQTLYSIFYPQNTTVYFSGYIGCVTFAGYHSDFVFDGGVVPYSVNLTCPDDGWGDGTNGNTMSASHEFFEAITDPQAGSPAYLDDSQSYPWFSWGGNELGDICMGLDPVFYNGFPLQRVWSNQAAAQSVGPACIPAPSGEIYFNVDISPQAVWVAKANQSAAQSKSYTLTGWSTAAHPNWFLFFQRAPLSTFRPSIFLSPPAPEFVNNGSTVKLELVVPANTPAGYSGLVLWSLTTDMSAHGNTNVLSVVVE